MEKSSTKSETSLISLRKGGRSFQIFAAFAASISAFSLGNVIGWTSQISAKMTEGEMGFEITTDQLGWIGSLSAIGAAFMALLIGYICDKIGRKLTKLLLVFPMASGWALLVWPSSVPMLYVGRMLTGMSMGAFMVTNPVYINEITQKEIRGILGSLTQLFISGGILFDAIVGKFASIQHYTLYCFVVPLIFGCVFVFMPETPIYYLRKGEEEAAEKVLRKLRPEDYDIEAEIENLKSSLSMQQEGNSFQTFKDSWRTHPSTRLAFYITLVLMILRVLCGIDAITVYTSLIFRNATDFDPSLGTIIVISIQSLVGIFQSAIIDRVGRKILLLISQILISISLLAVGISFLLKSRNIVSSDAHETLDALALSALSIYSVGFSLGIAPIPLILNAELNPPETKSLVSSFNTFTSWLVIFGVTKSFLVMEEGWGIESAFLLFGVLSLLGVLFVIVFVPETKGKSHKEIRETLESHRLARFR
ncbi:hypothetical protein Trydic_g21294 [Trypoxylus dichotomus]